MVERERLIERLRRCRKSSNALDMEVEIALLKPDEDYAAVRPNSAGTKLIYTMTNGSEMTCLAWDWTMHKGKAIAALQSQGDPLNG